jgi:AcrR family transcriptional regulator
MAQSDTVDRILDAAEELFAERGFSETSLRMITGKAGVNLAAVNYHFGSKKSLIQAVFARFLTPFCLHLEAGFDRLEQEAGAEPPSLDGVLQALTETVVEMPRQHDRSIAIYMRLQGLAYTQSQGHLRRFLEQEYSHTFGRFMRLLKDATPELSAVDRYWRIQFMLGSTAFTLSSSDALTEILWNKLGVETNVEEIVDQLVPFLAAGMRGPPVVGGSDTRNESA